jgi:hypothetical protein
MEFRTVKRSFSKKKKLMLFIDEELIEKLEKMKPIEITNQEAIRQIVRDFIEDYEMLGGL